MRAWTVRGGSEGEEGWGLWNVREMVGASEATAGPPCHRIWVVVVVCVDGWDLRSEGGGFILTVLRMDPMMILLVLPLLLHRRRDRMQEVQNVSID